MNSETTTAKGAEMIDTQNWIYAYTTYLDQQSLGVITARAAAGDSLAADFLAR